MQSMSTLTALVRRELWESPGILKWTPLIIAALILFIVIFGLIIGSRFDAELAFTLDAIRTFAEQPLDQRRLFVSGALFAASALFFQLMILLLLFYLAGSLYDDRKDRSILFWKSLPVSDTMTVASKVATACLLAPALFLAAVIVTQVVLLLIATGYGLAAGINPITAFWVPAALPRLWLVMALGLVIQALWLLPVYGWLLFCSSWAPRVPLLIAVAIPAGVAIAQHAWSLFSVFRMPELNIGLIAAKRLFTGIMPSNINWQIETDDSAADMTDIQFNEELFMSFSHVFSYLGRMEMWAGLLIAAILIAGAIWFRRRATDN